MKSAMQNVFLAASLTALAIPVVAQASGVAGEAKSRAHKQAVQQPKKHPQKGIAPSVQNRKRTAGEAASLERKEAGMNAAPGSSTGRIMYRKPSITRSTTQSSPVLIPRAPTERALSSIALPNLKLDN